MITNGLEDDLPPVCIVLNALGKTKSSFFHNSLTIVSILVENTQNGPTNLKYLCGDMVRQVSLELRTEDDESRPFLEVVLANM
jgi:hypothetical protein